MERCDWCLCNEKMIKYHDEEWGVPVHDDRKLQAVWQDSLLREICGRVQIFPGGGRKDCLFLTSRRESRPGHDSGLGIHWPGSGS